MMDMIEVDLIRCPKSQHHDSTRKHTHAILNLIFFPVKGADAKQPCTCHGGRKIYAESGLQRIEFIAPQALVPSRKVIVLNKMGQK